MKGNLKNLLILLLMLTLILTSCGGKKSEDQEDNEVPMATETEEENQEEADTTTTSNEQSGNDDEATDTETDTETEIEAEEEGEIDVGLLDRALLETITYNLPDSLMMVAKEEDSDETSIITTYQKGYSTREERLTDGVTEIDIYNEKEGVRYSYTLGETTGSAYRDDEDDKLDLEEQKAMEGRSLMSLFEEDVWGDMKILADRDKINGRKAIMIEMVNTDPDEEYDGMMKFWFDAEYTVPLKVIFDFGEEWRSTTEVTDIKFNLKLKDELFEAPDDVTFTEY